MIHTSRLGNNVALVKFPYCILPVCNKVDKRAKAKPFLCRQLLSKYLFRYESNVITHDFKGKSLQLYHVMVMLTWKQMFPKTKPATMTINTDSF